MAFIQSSRLHHELVNAAKSFSLCLQPSDNAPVTTSNLFIDYSAMPISFCPPKNPTYPMHGDILKKLVHKKKRTNEQFHIVCSDALATQPTQPVKKKIKITPKIKSGRVVKNEVTERLPIRRSPRFATPGALRLPASTNQKTVVLDLDSTLICAIKCLPPRLPPRDYDFLVKYYHNSVKYRYVKKRPYVDEFIKYLSQKNMEIVVFTAAEEQYASATLDKLDPNGLISRRLYKSSCKRLDGMSVKDLSELGRDLKNVVIIDDQPKSYRLQPENAIPIKPFVDDLQDYELKKLMDEFFDKCHQFKDLKDALKHYLCCK